MSFHFTLHACRVVSLVSIVSAVRPPQRWPGDSGVGGALVQSHACHAPVGGGGGGETRMHYVYTPVGVQQTGKIDELCVCEYVCVCVCVPGGTRL